MHQLVPRRQGRTDPGATADVPTVHQLNDAAPIIEREYIDLVSDFGRWMARHGKRDDYCRTDASPLVAAMRAYLAWEYGDVVPVPTE